MYKRSLPLAGALAFLAALTACVPRTTPPTPAPPPPAPPPRPVPPPPAPPPLAWQDAPASPGDWSYRGEGAGSVAAFGPPGAPSLLLRCDPGRRLTLLRTGATAGTLTVRTSFGDRAVAATPQAGGLAATMSPSDPLLDQMVFSRGRFAVEAPGTPLLIIPAWPEPARVIEDCRG